MSVMVMSFGGKEKTYISLHDVLYKSSVVIE